MSQTIITINGVAYDSATGQPVEQTNQQSNVTRHSSDNARAVHVQLQKSNTLSRRYVHPAKTTPISAARHAVNPATAIHAPIEPARVERSPMVSHFAPLSSTTSQAAPDHVTVRQLTKPASKPAADIRPAVTHPAVQRYHDQRKTESPAHQATAQAIKPSDVIKREAIAEATAKMPAKSAKSSKKATKLRKSRQKQRSIFGRLVSFGSAATAIVFLGAYVTYLNMPAISTRVAAAQAGINATYPGYKPTGYSLNGPVAYSEGSVSMKFAANGSPESYTLDQARTGWDSSALLENYITPRAGDNYTTITSGGLTIYSYGNNSAWINNGILYTITGSAVLSNSQVERIATSL